MASIDPESRERLLALFSKWKSLTRVAHATHLSSARIVVKDSLIKAEVPSDCEAVRTLGLPVVWLSARHYPQSYFGSCAFSFPWVDLIGDRSLYFVESVTQYGQPTVRVLLAGADKSGALRPVCAKYIRKGTGADLLYNDFYAIQFLYAGNIPLSSCSRLDYFDHGEWCARSGGSCSERGTTAANAAAQMTAFILAGSRSEFFDLFCEQSGDGRYLLRDDFKISVMKILSCLEGDSHRKSDVRKPLEHHDIGRFLNAYAIEGPDGAKDLLKNVCFQDVRERFADYISNMLKGIDRK